MNINPTFSLSSSGTGTLYSMKIAREKNLEIRSFFKSMPKEENPRTDDNKYEEKENTQEKWRKMPQFSQKRDISAYKNNSIPALQKILNSKENNITALQKILNSNEFEILVLQMTLNLNRDNFDMLKCISNYMRNDFINNNLIRELNKTGETATEEELKNKGIKAVHEMKNETKEKALYLSLIYPKAIEMLIQNGLKVSENPIFRKLTDHRHVEEGTVYKDAAPMSCSINPEIFSRHMKGSVKNSISLYIFGAIAANVSALGSDFLEYEAEAIPRIKDDDEYEVLLKAEKPLGDYAAILQRREKKEKDLGDHAAILQRREKKESVSLKRRHSIASIEYRT